MREPAPWRAAAADAARRLRRPIDDRRRVPAPRHPASAGRSSSTFARPARPRPTASPRPSTRAARASSSSSTRSRRRASSATPPRSTASAGRATCMTSPPMRRASSRPTTAASRPASSRRSRRSVATTSSSRSSPLAGARSATGSAGGWPSASPDDATLADRVRVLAVLQDEAGYLAEAVIGETARSGCASTTARSTRSPAARRRRATPSWRCSASCSAPDVVREIAHRLGRPLLHLHRPGGRARPRRLASLSWAAFTRSAPTP